MEIKKDYSRILGDLDINKLLNKPKKRYYKRLAGLISLAIVITKLTHVPEIYPYMESVDKLEPNPKRNVNHLLPSFTSVRFFENWDYDLGFKFSLFEKGFGTSFLFFKMR